MAKKIAFCSLFGALAIIIGYLEKFIIIPIPIPGIKLGLSNIVTVVILYKFSSKEALTVLIIRILVLGILFGGLSSIIYSLAGGIVSFFVMFLAKKINVFGIIGVSVLGAYFHNIAQISIASLVVQNTKIFYYMPFLMIAGIVTGIFIGFISFKIKRHIN